jgi:hypothetical protein
LAWAKWRGKISDHGAMGAMPVAVIVAVVVAVIVPMIVAGRVAPGDRSPRAPTDPDLRDSRIRLLSGEIR